MGVNHGGRESSRWARLPARGGAPGGRVTGVFPEQLCDLRFNVTRSRVNVQRVCKLASELGCSERPPPHRSNRRHRRHGAVRGGGEDVAHRLPVAVLDHLTLW
jgi:hypothetical protein